MTSCAGVMRSTSRTSRWWAARMCRSASASKPRGRWCHRLSGDGLMVQVPEVDAGDGKCFTEEVKDGRSEGSGQVGEEGWFTTQRVVGDRAAGVSTCP